MDAAIDIDHLTVVRNKITVLDGLSVTLPKGKIIGLLGPSGAGKTTLIRTLVGAQRITTGQATILGQPVGSKLLRQQISYMPQEAATYRDLTILENLRYFATIKSVDAPQIDKILRQVELYKYRHQLASNLSGGQASRVSLAIALLGQPKILFLDEPTSGLDPALRQQLWQLFHRLAKQGTSLIISSHVMDEARRCDELLLIRNGKILAYDSPNNICQQTNSQSVEESFLKLIEDKNV